MKNFQYTVDVGNYPLLSKEEEFELIARAAAGDSNARKKLVVSNLRFVVKEASKYAGCGLNMDDLIEAGNLGLVIASEKVKPGCNSKFLTYASWWIRESIQSEIRNMAAGVRIPANAYQELASGKWNCDSLDRPVGKSNDGEYVGNFLNDKREDFESSFVENECYGELYQKLLLLSEIERNVIVFRYGLFGNSVMSFAQIGRKYGYTREGIAQIAKRGLRKLRAMMKKNGYSEEFMVA